MFFGKRIRELEQEVNVAQDEIAYHKKNVELLTQKHIETITFNKELEKKLIEAQNKFAHLSISMKGLALKADSFKETIVRRIPCQK